MIGEVEKTIAGVNVHPDWDWTPEKFESEFEAAIAIGRERKNCCSTTAWKLKYSEFLHQIRRFRFAKDHKCCACKHFVGTTDFVVENFFHTFFWVIGERAKMFVLPQFLMFRDKSRDFCVHQYRAATKHITGIAKAGGQYGNVFWRYYCYWEIAPGFLPQVEDDELESDVMPWLLQVHENGNSEEERYWYHERLFRATVSFLRTYWQRPPEVPSLDDWVSKAAWMRGRGGTGDKTTVYLGGKRIKTRSNKGVDAVYYSDKAIRNELFQVTPQRMYVMQKSEPAKIRPVVKADNQNFRKMDFLSEVVEWGLKGCERSTLFLSARQSEALDMSVLDSLRENVNVPLDQGSFDNNQSRSSILTIMVAMYVVCLRDEPRDEYRQVWAALWDSFTSEKSRVFFNGKEYPWVNGVASGWRWTALLDTLLNIASFDVLSDIARALYGDHFYGAVHQGDDIIFKASGKEAVRHLLGLYKHFGYQVHDKKTFVSSTRTEFLRRSYEEAGIVGYIARTLTGLLFRNPIREHPLSKLSRLYDRAVTAELCIYRGADANRMAEMITEDLRTLGIPVEHAADYYLTPGAVGGCGFSHEDHGIGGRMSRYSTGVWRRPRIEEEDIPTMTIDLGMWKERFARYGFKERSDEADAMKRDLLATWGLRAAQIRGKIVEYMEIVPQVTPLPPNPGSGMVIPPPSRLWLDSKIPTLLRPHLKNQLVREDRFWEYTRPEYHAMLRVLKRKCSHRLFEAYLTDRLSVPSPVVFGVGLRYGQEIKKLYDRYMYSFLDVNENSVAKFERRMLWLENYARHQLKSLQRYGVLAQ